MRQIILDKIKEILEESDLDIVLDTIEDKTVLLETGLDSLGFAILVTSLEEELGFDPFQIMDEPVYPVTFGEFVSIYERNNGK